MQSLRITDHTGSSALILPDKGATVISYQANGQEYLYRDDVNLESSERPRCGIPFLFPVFGRTPADSPYPMEIHGFAHTSVWNVEEHTESVLRLSLRDNEETRKVYPFPFRVELTFSMEDGRLTIRQRYENPGEESMPYAFGFHPYFAVGDPETARVQVNAPLEMDMSTGKPAPYTKSHTSLTFPPNAPEAGAFFLQASDCVIVEYADGKKLRMNFDGHFNRIVLWAVKGKEFLCAEPINSSPNGLVTGDCLKLDPGACVAAEVSFEAI